MQELADFLIAIGPLGMFFAAFLAGSFFPFSSELVMVGLLGAGSNATSLLIWGTLGNTFGGYFNYLVGSMGKEEWITRRLKIDPGRLRRGKVYVRHYGAWAGLLSWLPILGSVITIAMGYVRTNRVLSAISIFLGKYVRYQILISAWQAATN